MPKAKTPTSTTSPTGEHVFGVDPTADAKITKITKQLLGEKETKSASLPQAPAELVGFINRANELRISIARQEEELKAIKEGLIAEAVSADVPGYRTETACIIVNTRTRTTLDKNLLLTKLSAQDIAECYVEGAAYYEARIQEVK